MTPPPTLTVAVPGAPGADHPVQVEPGAVATLAGRLAEHAPAHRYLLVTDTTVAGLHGERVLAGLRAAGATADMLAVEPGERSKSPATWAGLLERIAATGAGRDACVIALGGGVIGDLAGFAAATWMRGVPLVQVPTTLLAMVDAAVGGKTALDLDAGKNLAGAFHFPRLVVCDTRLLATLPPAALRAGLAEAVKHGAIADADYAASIETDADALLAGDAGRLAAVVARSIAIKADVVGRDPREAGDRAALNFGHTVGHALEQLSGWSLPHGEAVAIGMVAEARIGERIGASEAGTAASLERILARLGLPTRLPAPAAPAAIVAAAAGDKKARAGRTRYTLIARLGAIARPPDGAWTWAVEPAEAGAALHT